MNTAWNRWCRNLPSGTALSLYDNRITLIIITDITGRRNVRIQNPYTCTTTNQHDTKSPFCLVSWLREVQKFIATPIGIRHIGRVKNGQKNWVEVK